MQETSDSAFISNIYTSTCIDVDNSRAIEPSFNLRLK